MENSQRKTKKQEINNNPNALIQYSALYLNVETKLSKIKVFKNMPMTLLCFLQKCVKDTLSHISIKLNFSQVDSESTNTVLNVDNKRQAVVEVCTVTTAEDCRQSHELAPLLIFFIYVPISITKTFVFTYRKGWDVKWKYTLTHSTLALSKWGFTFEPDIK